MRPSPDPDRPLPSHRRLVVATALEPQHEDELERVSWPRTVLRLAVQPELHPWKRAWRLQRRGPLFALAAAVLLLLLLAASGCASTPRQSLRQGASAPQPGQGVRCESLLVSQELQLPLEGELGDVRLAIRDIPEVTGKLRVLVRQPRFAGALDLESDQKPAFDKVLEVAPGQRQLTVVLTRPRGARDDWPRSSCKACRVDVELTGLFGAREALDSFFARAMPEASLIESGFSTQTVGRIERTDAGLREVAAALAGEGRRCGVALEPAI